VAAAGSDSRGRLSSIDLLPDDAEPEILWAIEQLRSREKPSNAILAEFNARLADRGIGAISKSAWGRYSVRKAVQFRRHDEARRMSAELVAQLGEGGADEVTVMVAELLKVSMFEALEGRDLKTKEIMELSRGLSSVVGAQKASAEYRRKLQEEVDVRLRKAAAAVTEVGARNGVGAVAHYRIRRWVTRRSCPPTPTRSCSSTRPNGLRTMRASSSRRRGASSASAGRPPMAATSALRSQVPASISGCRRVTRCRRACFSRTACSGPR